MTNAALEVQRIKDDAAAIAAHRSELNEEMRQLVFPGSAFRKMTRGPLELVGGPLRAPQGVAC